MREARERKEELTMLPKRIPKVDEVLVIERRGPWVTKSGGELNVLFAISINDALGTFFNYDESELLKIPSDIRGLRSYHTTDLAANQVGGTEFHRIRQEFVFVLKGAMLWTCEDLLGKSRDFRMDGGFAIWMPQFIRHTYKVLEDNTEILLVANTLFIPDDPRTHDTYPDAEFRELQKKLCEREGR